MQKVLVLELRTSGSDQGRQKAKTDEVHRSTSPNGSRRMTTQVRTPRKRKIWGTRNAVISVSGASSVETDLLASLETELGVAETAGLTVMRMIGKIQLVQAGAASTAAFDRYYCGIGWIPEALDPGDVKPWVPGTREAEWIQQGMIEGKEGTSSLETGMGLEARPDIANTWLIDSTQMRKQPTPKHELKLVMTPDVGRFESGTVNALVVLSILLALP